MKKALIRRIKDQDGAYPAVHLLNPGYRPYDIFRRASSTNFLVHRRIRELATSHLFLVEYDLIDLSASIYLLQATRFAKVFILAAQSFVDRSFRQTQRDHSSDRDRGTQSFGGG